MAYAFHIFPFPDCGCVVDLTKAELGVSYELALGVCCGVDLQDTLKVIAGTTLVIKKD